MKKILVIEDNPGVRENLEEVLELYGYEVSTAANGKEGVQQALNDPPDLILCDVMMPELDGYGVLNILSSKAQTSDIPFVFLTAKTEKSDMRRGMNLGADDYITKPYYKDELLKVIELRLQKSERIRKSFDRTEAGLKAFIDEARGYKELQKLSESQKTRNWKKKEMIYEEGEYPRYLFFIKKGVVKIFKTNDNGKEYILDVYNEGDFIGYTALIQDTKYTDSAAALEECELSAIPKEDFMRLLHANRDVSSRFIKLLAHNIEDKEEKLLHLAYDSVRKRVADALILLHNRYLKEGRNEIQILREDLAHIVGTAKESVIRMLSEFRDDGYISIKDGLITILEKEKLEKLIG